MATRSDSVDSNKVTIQLDRGKTGLGFNIKGGSDMPLIPGDDGIYVAMVKPEGAAALDGRLKVGDKIVQVNGVSLESVKHEVAVTTFVKAGPSVTMVVISGAEKRAKKEQILREEQAGGGGRGGNSHTLYYISAGVGLGILLGLFLVFRRRHV